MGKYRSLKDHLAWEREMIARNARFHRERRANNKDTDIELLVQEMLTELEIRFQADVRLLPPPWRGVDIYIPSRRLVIECDGDYWHSTPEVIERDLRKTETLRDAGYKVLRLWGSEITKMNSDDLWARLETVC